MPFYNYKCKCGNEFESFEKMTEREVANCKKCGKIAKQTLCKKPPAVHGFKLGLFEHIGKEPMYIKDKKQLKVALRDNECYAPGVLD